MDLSTAINTSFLCVFNVIFMIAGIFLNSVVIISLWRSSQLRKKLCYFTILVLSCFDLAAVAIMHPIQISTTISIAFGKYSNTQEVIRFYLANAINSLSMFALLVLNIERFLALSYPFFHQTSVTKERLIFLLVALMILPTVIVLSLTHLSLRLLANLVSTIGLSVFLLLFIYLNYKVFKIARSKHDIIESDINFYEFVGYSNIKYPDNEEQLRLALRQEVRIVEIRPTQNIPVWRAHGGFPKNLHEKLTMLSDKRKLTFLAIEGNHYKKDMVWLNADMIKGVVVYPVEDKTPFQYLQANVRELSDDEIQRFHGLS